MVGEDTRTIHQAAPSPRRRLSLMAQIVVGLVTGIAAGLLLNRLPGLRGLVVPDVLKPVGDIFIRLMQMIVVPLVFASMATGVARGGHGLGRLGAKTLGYFFAVTGVAILIGLVAGNLLRPGTGMNLASLTPVAVALPQAAGHANAIDLLVEIVPSNVVAAMVEGKLLPVLFFAALFGLGVARLPSAPKSVLMEVLQALSQTMFNITALVMAYSPIGVFGLIGVTVADFGLASLLPLVKLVAAAYATVAFFIIAVLGSIAWAAGISLLGLIRHIRSELVLAFSTASSATVLARLMAKLESFGVPAPMVAFIVPVGYSFNLDGAALFVGLGTLFVSQLYNIDLDLGKQVMLVATMIVTSKGAAGVPGFMFVILSATLASAGLPLEGIAFIAGIYRLIDMPTTMLNVLGNALAPIVIARWEGVPAARLGAQSAKTL